MNNIVVVGAGYAGLTCALRLSRRVRQFGLSARVQLVSPRPAVVERIRLHQWLTGQALVERRLVDLLKGTGVELVSGAAETIDLHAQTLQVAGRDISWDRLVLATGSSTDVHRVPGAAEHAIAVEPDTTRGLMQSLSMVPRGARVVVIGGGLTAIEIASEVAERLPHLDVHLVSRGRVAQEFSPAARGHILRTLSQKLRVEIHEDQDVLAVTERHVQTATTAIPFDLCIWSAGFVAAPLPAHPAMKLNGAGQVLVDSMLRSISHPHVYVAGDMGAPVTPPGQPLPMGCKSAMPMGAHVAENIIRDLRGDDLQKFDYALMFYCVSLGRGDGLIQWGDEQGHLTGRMLTGRRAAYFKEMICRSTMWAIRLEAWGVPAVVWKHTGKVDVPVKAMDQEWQ
jgi:NADH:ubiquinone reductase (H+-translocating)